MKKCLKINKESCPKCGEQADRVSLFEAGRQRLNFIGLKGWRCDCGFSEPLNEEEIMLWKKDKKVIQPTQLLF